jgi:hypothetical protein
MPEGNAIPKPEERYNVSPEGNADAVNFEGIPDEAAKTADVSKEKHEEAQETQHASEEEEREKELEKK